MQSMPPNMVVLLVIILVPTIPSYLLFKLLPSSAVVNGPFKGLRIDLGGGFAGYFLIFITLVGIRAGFEATNYQKWSVVGQIIQPDAPNTPYVDPRYVTLSVPSLRSDSNGNFTMDFLTTSDGQLDYPHLYINFPCCQPKTYWLGPKEQNVRHESLPVNFDTKNRVIDLGIVQLVKQSASVVNTGPAVPAASQPVNPYGGQPQ